MPLTEKGEEIKGAMAKSYGPEKGEKVFYASKNKGTIAGVDEGEEGESKGKEDFVKSIAGPAAALALSDEGTEDMPVSLGDAEERFDELRDKLHKLDKRLDDCDAQDAGDPCDDQITEHYDQMGNPVGKSRRYGVKDGALLTTPTGKKLL